MQQHIFWGGSERHVLSPSSSVNGRVAQHGGLQSACMIARKVHAPNHLHWAMMMMMFWGVFYKATHKNASIHMHAGMHAMMKQTPKGNPWYQYAHARDISTRFPPKHNTAMSSASEHDDLDVDTSCGGATSMANVGTDPASGFPTECELRRIAFADTPVWTA